MIRCLLKKGLPCLEQFQLNMYYLYVKSKYIKLYSNRLFTWLFPFENATVTFHIWRVTVHYLYIILLFSLNFISSLLIISHRSPSLFFLHDALSSLFALFSCLRFVTEEGLYAMPGVSGDVCMTPGRGGGCAWRRVRVGEGIAVVM